MAKLLRLGKKETSFFVLLSTFCNFVAGKNLLTEMLAVINDHIYEEEEDNGGGNERDLWRKEYDMQEEYGNDRYCCGENEAF